MTTNQTIDGVPRELAEDAAEAFAAIWMFERLEELRALLDAPACADHRDEPCQCIPFLPAAQPRGEPVAWRYREGEGAQWRLTDMPPSTWYFDPRQYEVRKLYEQPAPVAVVLPSVAYTHTEHCDTRFNAGWNACLDEVTRLNGSKP